MLEPRRTLASALAVALATMCAMTAGCKSCEEDEKEEQEERNRERDHFWRAQITIVGQGSIKTREPGFDCSSDGTAQRGECGPKLLKFKEMKPPLMEALPAPGFRLDHWESLIREPGGTEAPRRGPMPDGRFYINGFGFTDTGQLDKVTAVFVPQAQGGDAHGPAEPR